MTINERIERVSEYFKGFNIANDTSFVFVKFPDSWSTFDESDLNTKYNVYTGKKDDGVYFIAETKHGIDCLFDAIEYIIESNKALEEKTALLQVKAKELTELFLNEPLEKLKTLEFTFNYKKPVKRGKKPSVVKENVIAQQELIVEEVITEKEVEPVVETKEPDVVTEKTKQSKSKKNNKNSSVMDFAKSLTKK